MFNTQTLKTTLWRFVFGAPPTRPVAVPTEPALLARLHAPGSPFRLEDILSVELWRTVGLPLQSLDIVEHVGRVYLVSFTPHRRADPLFPIPLVELGDAYRRAAGRYAHHLLAWPHTSDPARWSREAKKRLQHIYAILNRTHALSRDEYRFLYLKLALAAARPS